MRYNQITDVPEFKYATHRCLKCLCDEDRKRSEKKFREQCHDSEQSMHTFGELILGAHLSSCGLKVKYEYSVDGKTPDWCIMNDRLEVIGIVDLVNAHRDKETEDEIDKQMQAKGHAIFWSRENLPKYRDRLYQSIWGKIGTYLDLAQNLELPYIVAICPDWRAGIDFEKVLPCLYHKDYGLFQMYEHVSGVLYFEGNFAQYSFRYIHNPNALRKFDVPEGVFSLVPEQGILRGDFAPHLK